MGIYDLRTNEARHAAGMELISVVRRGLFASRVRRRRGRGSPGRRPGSRCPRSSAAGSLRAAVSEQTGASTVHVNAVGARQRTVPALDASFVCAAPCRRRRRHGLHWHPEHARRQNRSGAFRPRRRHGCSLPSLRLNRLPVRSAAAQRDDVLRCPEHAHRQHRQQPVDTRRSRRRL